MFHRLTNAACLAMSRMRSCVSSRKRHSSSIIAGYTRNGLRDACACNLFLIALSAAILCLGQISPALALSSAVFNHSNQTVETAAYATYGDFEVSGDTSSIAFDVLYDILTLSGGEHTISMAPGVTSTAQRIEVTGAATLTLAGVNIKPTSQGSALRITPNATFNVDILLADDTENVLEGTSLSSGAAGLEKCSGMSGNYGKLTIGVPANAIKRNGCLKAKGDSNGAGIGGVSDDYNQYPTSNITIEAGVITALGGLDSAGIGGSRRQGAADITISGGIVTAKGGDGTTGGGAGIGGGNYGGVGNNIKITGGTVIATGGATGYDMFLSGSGIGNGGYSASSTPPASSGNVLNGDAVVLATSGDSTVAALTGFDATSGFVQGISFVRQSTRGSWTGTIYGSEVAITADTEFPANLTVGNGTTIKNEANLTFARGVSLTCTGSGKLETLLKYNPQGGSFDDVSDSYQLYQDASGTQGKWYQNLPQPTTNATFGGWFTGVAGQGEEITSTSDVQLNLHQVYADMSYTVTFDSQGGSAVSPITDILFDSTISQPSPDPTKAGLPFAGWFKEPACTNKWDFATDTVQEDTTLYAGWVGDMFSISTVVTGQGSIQVSSSSSPSAVEVDFTLVPEDGYKYDEGSLSVLAGATPISVTDKGNLAYSFEMPASDVTISASFVADEPTPPGPGPEPTPTPTPEPVPATDGSDILPVTGDATQSIGLFAVATAGLGTVLALLGGVYTLAQKRDA